VRIEGRSLKTPIVFQAEKKGSWGEVPTICLGNGHTSKIAEVLVACHTGD